ncbi:MAG TPA: hypothetical protein VNN77_18990 [candidate division Zixibacteria bacterium]|nr:hypothetical protein [candidate division Zixibacteria bacterium]
MGGWSKLRELLFPEHGGGDGASHPAEPMEILVGLFERLEHLARQLEFHAEAAPYPHVGAQLRRIAAEKHEQARWVRSLIERERGWARTPSGELAAGKNHWARLMQDVRDQAELENFIVAHELRLADDPETSEILRRIKGAQDPHRRHLARLLAVADPQATQT